jgi:hypothetical protein
MRHRAQLNDKAVGVVKGLVVGLVIKSHHFSPRTPIKFLGMQCWCNEKRNHHFSATPTPH